MNKLSVTLLAALMAVVLSGQTEASAISQGDQTNGIVIQKEDQIMNQ